MKTITALMPITCFALAGAAAVAGAEGWGWFLVVGVMIWMAS